MSNTNRIKAFLDAVPDDVHPEEAEESDEEHDEKCLHCWARAQEDTYGPLLVTDMIASMAHQSAGVRESVHQAWVAFCARDWGACSPAGLEINDASFIDGGMLLGVYPFGMFKVAILGAPGRRVVSISLFQEAESSAIAATMAVQAAGMPVVRLPIDEFRRRL